MNMIREITRTEHVTMIVRDRRKKIKLTKGSNSQFTREIIVCDKGGISSRQLRKKGKMIPKGVTHGIGKLLSPAK